MLTLSYSLPAQKYDSPEKMNAFNEALLESCAPCPASALLRWVRICPEKEMEATMFTIKEHPPLKPGEGLPERSLALADPGYFSALQIPLLSGRFFTSDDRPAARRRSSSASQLPAIFPGRKSGWQAFMCCVQNDADYEIVGVVGDTLWQVGQPIRPTMYFPFLMGRATMEGSTLPFARSPIHWQCPFRCRSRLQRSIPNCPFPMC